MFAARAMQEMLLTSHGGLIRVFPGVPDAWRDVSFADLRVEGAFLVSAERRGGVTCAVRLESLAGEPCRIRTTLSGPVRASGRRAFTVTELPGSVITVDLGKGETVTLYSGDGSPALKPGPVALVGKPVRWGLRKPAFELKTPEAVASPSGDKKSKNGQG